MGLQIDNTQRPFSPSADGESEERHLGGSIPCVLEGLLQQAVREERGHTSVGCGRFKGCECGLTFWLNAHGLRVLVWS